jgi:hypothetical protein
MKMVQGTFRADRHDGEIPLPAKWPAAPVHLNARERELWNALEGQCGSWVAASDWMAVNGAVSLMDRILTLQAAPAGGHIALEMKLWTALRGYIAILGLSPADRTRVPRPTEEKTASPLDRFMKARRG